MRKIFIALAAIAAVGCSKEMTPNDMPTNDTFALNASIVLDDTRVTIGGDKFTEVSWEVGDKIRVESVAGFNAELEATESGRTDIRFEGTESPKATVDTYYAVYPSSNISNAKVTFYLDNQPGDDVAALVAKTEGVESSGLTMEFKPVNSLLHVAVNGVESLSKAEFKSYTGKTLVADFTYNYADDNIEYGTDTVASYEVETPSADGFFFSLPADLDMSEGYVVTLTDANGNVCAKAYNGMSFERGKTTRVTIEWSIPSVTLGAKTSYSYYLAGDSATANKCANTDIFFVTGKNGESCASSYAGVQDAMITDLGYEVDGATYTYSAGQVSWDKGNNTFSMISNPSYSTAWGEKTGIKAFIVVNGKKVYSTNNLWLTGLPYYTDWRAGNNTDWKYIDGSYQSSAFRINCTSSRWGGYIVGGAITPEFKIPDTSIRVYGAIAASTRATDTSQSDRCYIYSGNRDSATVMEGDYVKIYYSASGSTFPDTELVKMSNPSTLTASNPCLVFAGETYRIPAIGTNLYTYFYQAQITYAEK